MVVTPSLQAMWMADDVSLDSRTRKVAVKGLFNQIEIKAPASSFSTPVCLFFAVSNLRAASDLRLCYVDLSSLEVLRTRMIRVESNDPLEITDVVIRINRMPVPHPGVYAWELYYDGVLLGSSRVNAFVKG